MIPVLNFKISDYEAEEIACQIAGLDFNALSSKEIQERFSAHVDNKFSWEEFCEVLSWLKANDLTIR